MLLAHTSAGLVASHASCSCSALPVWQVLGEGAGANTQAVLSHSGESGWEEELGCCVGPDWKRGTPQGPTLAGAWEGRGGSFPASRPSALLDATWFCPDARMSPGTFSLKSQAVLNAYLCGVGEHSSPDSTPGASSGQQSLSRARLCLSPSGQAGQGAEMVSQGLCGRAVSPDQT